MLGEDGTAETPKDYSALIRTKCDDLADLLVSKNRKYGASIFQPARILSKASTVEQILVRIDDKLSRLVHGEPGDEDVYLDLTGYLVILLIQLDIAKASATMEEPCKQ